VDEVARTANLKVPSQSWGWGAGRCNTFHDFESRERATTTEPGRPSDLSGPVCLLVLEHDVPVDLQADSFMFYDLVTLS
jgi:hypothetical protein